MRKIVMIKIFSVSLCLLAVLGSQKYSTADNIKIVKESENTRVMEEEQTVSFAPNEIIIKFKDDVAVGEVAEDLFKNKQDFQTITNDFNLDNLNTTHKVHNIKRVFKKILPAKNIKSAVISKKQANRFHTQAKKSYFEKLNPLKKNSKTKLPYLGNIYKFELDSTMNVQKICAAYEKDPHVEYAQPNYMMETQLVPNDPYYSTVGSWGQAYDDLWGLKKINAEQAWDISQGDGVVVAVVDTGADYTHPDLAANIWTNLNEIPNNGIDDDNNGFIDDVHGWDFANADNEPMDDHGHGTHVAGTVAAVGNNSLGVIGVAPQAQIMPLKGLSSSGSGSSEDLADAILYAAMNGADVINNSWGCSSPCPSNSTTEVAVRTAYGLGSVVVFAAGNNNANVNLYSPQNMLETITVASSTEIDAKSSFSNFSYLVDVTAPGGGESVSSPSFDPHRNILSLKSSQGTALDGGGQLVVGTEYVRQAGTSMAAPHVAGLVALILAQNSNFSVEQVRQAIRQGADDLGDVNFDEIFGYGRINTFRSLQFEQPLELIITEPFMSPITITEGPHIVPIQGLVSGENMVNWTLDFASQSTPENWIEIVSSSSEIQYDLLANWDISSLEDGDYILRLRAENLNGQTYEDYKIVTIDNFFISEPSEDSFSFVRPGEEVIIKGTINPGIFSSYEITIYKREGNNFLIIPGNNVVLPNGGTEPIINDVIAIWDTTGIEAGRYIFEVKPLGHQEQTVDIIVDPTIHVGWPIQIDQAFGFGLSAAFIRQLTVADINGDGTEEILIGYGNSLNVIDHTGQAHPGWPQPINFLLQEAPVVGDFTGNGMLEIAALANDGWLYVWKADGSLLPGWPQKKTNAGSLVLEDINGDNINELVVISDEYISEVFWGKIHVLDQEGNHLPGWPQILPNAGLSSPAVGDVNGDGKKEITFTTRYPEKKLYLFNYEGNILPGWPIESNTSRPPVFADLNDDSDLEILVPSDDGYIHAYHHDASIVDGWPQFTQDRIVNPLTVGDMDNDGLVEVLAGVWINDTGLIVENILYAFNGDGTPVNGWPVVEESFDYTTSRFGFGAVTLADVNGDGEVDVLASTNDEHYSFWAYHSNGTPLDGFPKPTASSGADHSITAAVADFDGDDLLEITWIDNERNLYLWDTSSPESAPRPWPMYLHDAAHSNNANRNPPLFQGTFSNRKYEIGDQIIYHSWAKDSDDDSLIYTALGLPLNAVFRTDVILGDINDDGNVNFSDLALLKSVMFKTMDDSEYNPRADLNNDGMINFGDLAIIKENFFGSTLIGLFEWIPTEDDIGDYVVTFGVSDGISPFVSKSVFLTNNILYNADFETETLIGWTTVGTSTDMGVELADVNGNGTDSYSYYIHAGSEEEEGIEQIVSLEEGREYMISADIAAIATINNLDAGLFEMFIDDYLIDSVQLGGYISAGIPLRDQLSGSFIPDGTRDYILKFRFNRSYAHESIKNYLDNVVLE